MPRRYAKYTWALSCTETSKENSCIIYTIQREADKQREKQRLQKSEQNKKRAVGKKHNEQARIEKRGLQRQQCKSSERG